MTPTAAKMTDGTLVVSFGGDAPKLWRADMAGAGAASFELQDANTQTAIVLKTAAGTETVQAFATRADAVAALQAITDALFSGARIAPAPVNAAPAPPKSFLGKFFKTVLYLLLAIICIILLWVAAQVRQTSHSEAVRSGTGIPVPADQMFGKEGDGK